MLKKEKIMRLPGISLMVAIWMSVVPSASAASPNRLPVAQDKVYEKDGWKLEIVITNPGTRSQGQSGTLTFNGTVLQGTKGEEMQTPLGKVRFVGDGGRPWDSHGWIMQIPEVKPRFLKNKNHTTSSPNNLPEGIREVYLYLKNDLVQKADKEMTEYAQFVQKINRKGANYINLLDLARTNKKLEEYDISLSLALHRAKTVAASGKAIEIKTLLEKALAAFAHSARQLAKAGKVFDREAFKEGGMQLAVGGKTYGRLKKSLAPYVNLAEKYKSASAKSIRSQPPAEWKESSSPHTPLSKSGNSKNTDLKTFSKSTPPSASKPVRPFEKQTNAENGNTKADPWTFPLDVPLPTMNVE